MSALNEQIGGNHYKKLTHQPIEVFSKYPIPIALYTAIKYLSRIGVSKDANGEGIRKAEHSFNIFMQLYREGNLPKLPPISDKVIQDYSSQFEGLTREVIAAMLRLAYVARMEKSYLVSKTMDLGEVVIKLGLDELLEEELKNASNS